jgi:type IV secretory pathway VirJ component
VSGRKMFGSIVVLCLVLAVASVARAGLPDQRPRPAPIASFPLREILATGPTHQANFIVFITGDGGWADIDNVITRTLAKDGYNVIGLDSRAYLRNKRTPDAVAEDVSEIVRAYSAKWNRTSFALVGY